MSGEIDNIIGQLNQDLHSLERQLTEPFSNPQLPTTFIVGSQRSGSSLLNQLMINNFPLFYPNNLIARFWEAPTVGTCLTKSILSQTRQNVSLNSHLGYTPEVDGPHEFGYFWRRFFPTGTIIEQQQLSNQKFETLVKTLAAMERYGGNALLFKNLVQVALNAASINQLLSNTLFIYIKREPFYTIQSTYLARLKLFNDTDQWFGIHPPGIDRVKDKSPFYQIAWQVSTVEQLLKKQLEAIPSSQQLTIHYEQLVDNPSHMLGILAQFLEGHGIKKPQASFHIGEDVQNENKVKVSNEIKNLIKQAQEEVSVK